MTSSHDRREFLRRAGLGAAVTGAWIAPQVLSTGVAHAACTPIDKCLQIVPSSCSSGGVPVDGTTMGSCVPDPWCSDGTNHGITYTCSSNSTQGSTITITSAGCWIVDAVAVKFCPAASGTKYFCVPGTISVDELSVTFPTIVPPPSCDYLVYRIAITCCT